MKNKKNLALFAAMAVLGLFVGGIFAYNYVEQERAKIAAEQKELFAPEHAPRMGAENPDVVLVEFLDPECEACRAFGPFVKELVTKRQERVQLVIRYAPFHQNSVFAVKVLEASRKQDKYWETLDVLFRYQDIWGGHHNPQPEKLWQYLPEAQLDLNQLRSDMEDPAIMERLEKDVADLQKLNVRATPTFFVNGQPLPSFGRAQLEEMVDAALQK